eukprot:6281604-Amphidinium_carterae.1
MAAQHGIDLVTTTRRCHARPQVGPQFFTAMQSRILVCSFICILPHQSSWKMNQELYLTSMPPA